MGFSVDQVVHDYGDLCQTITDLAFERDAPFQVDEFRTLNRCLDNAITDAVTEFSYHRDHALADKQALVANEQAGFFAHELRNALGTATLAFAAVKAGGLSRAENSHQPTLVPEKVMRRFKSAHHLQRFASVHDQVANLFMHCRYHTDSR